MDIIEIVYFDIDYIDIKFWLIFRSLAEIKCDKKKSYLVKSYYLTRYLNPPTITERQQSDQCDQVWQFYAKLTIFKFLCV